MLVPAGRLRQSDDALWFYAWIKPLGSSRFSRSTSLLIFITHTQLSV